MSMARDRKLAPSCWILALGLTLACGGGGSSSVGSGSGLPPGPGTLTASPIEVARITDLEPLGAMNPVGHTIPTDHVYFYFAWCPTCPPQNPPPVLSIVAPGAGTVTWILQQSGAVIDQKVMVQMTGDFYYYLDHVILDPAIQVGTRVTAGQRMGSSNGIAMDLGIMYEAVTLAGFVNPARYAGQTLHTG